MLLLALTRTSLSLVFDDVLEAFVVQERRSIESNSGLVGLSVFVQDVMPDHCFDVLIAPARTAVFTAIDLGVPFVEWTSKGESGILRLAQQSARLLALPALAIALFGWRAAASRHGTLV